MIPNLPPLPNPIWSRVLNHLAIFRDFGMAIVTMLDEQWTNLRFEERDFGIVFGDRRRGGDQHHAERRDKFKSWHNGPAGEGNRNDLHSHPF